MPYATYKGNPVTTNPSDDFTTTLPGKRMAAGALFFDKTGGILIVKPTYRDGWLIPGGTVDRDESPYTACRREVREELGLDLPVYQLLCVEYQSPQGTKTESLQFIFYGGVLTNDQIAAIRLPTDELAGYRFCSPDEAAHLLTPMLARRLPFALAALEENRTIYLEDKVEIGPPR